MPTGYTADILNGKIKTFPEFAKLCMRAFGATIHMRDDSLDAEYTPRVPSDYSQKRISEIKEELFRVENLTDEEILQDHLENLSERNTQIRENLSKKYFNKTFLNKILADVKKWIPPTQEHYEIKRFMISQIQMTIDSDCNPSYQQKELNQIEKDIKKSADVIRAELISQLKHDLAYHEDEYAKDLERCAESNKWVQDLINSLPKEQ